MTGGAGGIGRAYCRALAQEGAKLAVADMADSSEVVTEIEDLGAEAVSITVDVSDVASTEAMAAATVDAFGRIDALVNNAAFYMAATHAPFEDLTPEEWDLCFAVNVKGPWLCSRAVVPTMKAQGSGRIVNIASMTVNDGTPGFLHYVSSKAAIWGLTARSMASELGPHGIAVNTLTPDYIPHDEKYAALQPRDRRVHQGAPRLQADPGARGHGRHPALSAQPLVRLRHRTEHLGERRLRLPLRGATKGAS